jgi:ribosomal-protein-alanine N-acetyltransferase
MNARSPLFIVGIQPDRQEARAGIATVGGMPELQRLRGDHAEVLLAFELANRTYFSAWISDRGDAFYQRFPQEHGALLAEQEAGICAFYVLVDDDQTILGRFNLYDLDLEHGTANVGYRVAERIAGHGVATSAVRELCALAGSRHGLRMLSAGTSTGNVASQRVLEKVGFKAIGSAEVGGRPGIRYELGLDAA